MKNQLLWSTAWMWPMYCSLIDFDAFLSIEVISLLYLPEKCMKWKKKRKRNVKCLITDLFIFYGTLGQVWRQAFIFLSIKTRQTVWFDFSKCCIARQINFSLFVSFLKLISLGFINEIQIQISEQILLFSFLGIIFWRNRTFIICRHFYGNS